MSDELFDVLVVGGAGVDTIVRVDALPLPMRDSYAVPPVRDWAAHTGYGVALGCHSLGLVTKFVDFIGDDPQGEMLLAEYARRGVDFSHLVSADGTRRAVNLVDADGRRLSFYDGRDAADLRMPREFYLPYVKRARHVHLSIMNFAQYLYDDIERLGRPTSTDLHDWDGRNPYHRAFALRSEVVTLSAANLGGRRDEVMAGIVADGRAEVVVATAGADGCYLMTRDCPEVRHFPAVRLPGRPAVDSNGAGDAFVSGFLRGRRSGWSVDDCVRAGSIAGAYACGAEGTHADVIDGSTLSATMAVAK